MLDKDVTIDRQSPKQPQQSVAAASMNLRVQT